MDFRSFMTFALALVSILMIASCGKSDKPREIVAADANESNAQIERTLSIIKPNAVANNHIGAIVDRLKRTAFALRA